MQELVGSTKWLSTQTRPDITTITTILAQYNHSCSPGHIDSAKYAIRYLIDSAGMGIKFSSKADHDLESFVKFPTDPSQLTPLTDANWGPQDQSVPNPNDPPILLNLFKSRSITGYIIWLGGPLDWCSKCQTYTARSSAEAEIGEVNECTKTLQQIINVLKDLNLLDKFVDGPITIYKDNSACVQWSHNMSTKGGLRYIQIRENAVREQVQAGTVKVKHIAGKNNPSDICTKEDKDAPQYIEMRDVLVSFPPNHRPATINVKEIDSPITEPSVHQFHFHSSPSQEHVPETLSNNSKIHPLLALRAKGGC